MGGYFLNKDWGSIIGTWLWWWEANSHLGKTLLITCFLAPLIVSWYFARMKVKSSLPPGPRGLPILGNLPFIDPHLNVYFQKLAKTYGPIFKLRLGSKLCIVISSPAMAKEVLKEKDAIFAHRAPSILVDIFSYGGKDIGFAPYCAEWRMLRTVFAQEIMSKTNLNVTYNLRQQEVQRTLDDIYANAGVPLNVSDKIFVTMVNVIIRQLWGGLLQGKDGSSLGQQLKLAATDVSCLMATPNISDYFPALARFDIQGLERKMRKSHSVFDNILTSVIDQRISLNKSEIEAGKRESKVGKDFLDVLLKLICEDLKTPFTLTHLKALFMDSMIAGTDTSATAVEWAMARLMKYPKVMKKLQDEIERVVGNRKVEEIDIPNLHYLTAVVQETMRLHPPGPLLVPRCPSSSSNVSGYTIPEGTHIFVNVWAIHRDPEVWENPLEFQPERFLTSSNNWDNSGNDHRYMPFGSGRRICAGIPLVERMVPYTIASLVHMFKWSLEEGINVDFSERFGLVLKKEIPLVAIPTPRYQ